jgi:hypothetical protein
MWWKLELELEPGIAWPLFENRCAVCCATLGSFYAACDLAPAEASECGFDARSSSAQN